jgi:hypothetical protein
MRRVKGIFEGYTWDMFVIAATVALLVFGVTGVPSMGQQMGQKTFSSPEEASKALHTAASNNDEKALLEIFGEKGHELISSGDPAEDVENRATFVKRYEQMSRLVKEPDGTVTLYIGPHNWPFPIPLVNKGSEWYFDTEMGEKEIVFRRIGRNEMSAIHICQQLAAAQKDYFGKHNAYAQKMFSDDGKQDGLYWAAGDNTPQSPIGPRVAWAFVNDPGTKQGGSVTPYRGYFFEMLSAQGDNGFAFVAYPADYRSSGVKTFLVGSDGVVYEKDLGKKTESLAKSIKASNADKTWQKVEEQPQQAASGSSIN